MAGPGQTSTNSTQATSFVVYRDQGDSVCIAIPPPSSEGSQTGSSSSIDVTHEKTQSINCEISIDGIIKEKEEELDKQPKTKNQPIKDNRTLFEYQMICYEFLVWLFFGVAVVFATLDRFLWNLWPRQIYNIGNGPAGMDYTDGLLPGPWSVKLYDVCVRLTGRYILLAFNILLFTMMKTTMSWLAESWVAKYVVDMSNVHQANYRIHKYNGIGICVFTLVHIWCVLFPCIFHKFSSKVTVGEFEWPLSERSQLGELRVHAESQTVTLTTDDILCMVGMTILLGILMPLTVKWIQTRPKLGTQLHILITVIYLFNILRRHSHPHSWILNTPFVLLWIIDLTVGIFWRRNKPTVFCNQLSNDCMLLYWKQEKVSNIVGPRYYLKLQSASFLERAYSFTAFENRCGLRMANGQDWSVAVLVHVDRNNLWSSLHKGSNTRNEFNTQELNLTTWGPTTGSLSGKLKYSLHHSEKICIVASSCSVGLMIDALQQHRSSQDPHLTILYTTRDPTLFLQITEWIANIVSESQNTNINILIALTSLKEEVTVFTVRKEIQEMGLQSVLRVQNTRIDFTDKVPENCQVYFQGSRELQRAVKEACYLHNSCIVSELAFRYDSIDNKTQVNTVSKQGSTNTNSNSKERYQEQDSTSTTDRKTRYFWSSLNRLTGKKETGNQQDL
eukprot:TRINITY_DN4529_c0_g1_i2.p1 TRINITY_DN4529_c0_g1~~TRINITY_DN4529_c0_g1_i2.p1  ORF type:complete len:673 (-),score=7.54 TRINITY_DN4529_c0_g1_i2:3032-5050(-)